ncbi:class I SAM-dependent methyltransferase [Maridesulfovibrio sp.]|uniref:class I SAM-dependent methyltransferase n=1 Tax=Maridesulfovibrio sp. TaxID=2795000 RepID=UPI003BA8AA41
MKKQKDIFLEGEGDAWCHRNVAPERPLLVDRKLKELLTEVSPSNVLEVGCGSCYRLNFLSQSFPECSFYGIDPSLDAKNYGNSSLTLTQGTADDLPYESGKFDVVVFGFCLYLCDVEDYFKIAYEADRVLADGGFLVIIDFEPPFPYQNPYSHKDGIYSTKVSFRSMFEWHPSFSLVSLTPFSHRMEAYDAEPNERVSISVLHKKHALNMPIAPF